MRVLFAMPYPGYLRYFDSVVRGLADRGHTVDLWFETLEKQPEGLEAIDDVAAVRYAGQVPKRRDPFRDAARAVRLTMDYIRYLDARFASAHYLRERAARSLTGWMRHLHRLPVLPHAVVSRLIRALLVAERALPTSPQFDEWLAAERPDLVVAAPVLTPASRLADLLESAQAKSIPTVGAVASWDNFTTKGIFRVVPDTVLVWNAAQVDEGVELHHLPRDRFAVTGAQPFDRWFDRRPSRSRADFLERVGLPGDRQYVLFTGSTASISDPDAEIRFVLRWLEEMRSHGAPEIRELGVMIRPHPYNSAHWPEVDLAPFQPAVLWPPHGANPVNDDDRADYFDSIHHAAAVVGINTTAMIEAAIQRKPVLSIASSEFDSTQTGTLHFRYLLPENGGFLRVASSIGEHLDQLDAVLRSPAETRAQIDAFVESFLRPNGIDAPCTPIVLDVLEAATVKPRVADGPVASFLAAAALHTIFDGRNSSRRLRRKLSRLTRVSQAVLRD